MGTFIWLWKTLRGKRFPDCEKRIGVRPVVPVFVLSSRRSREISFRDAWTEENRALCALNSRPSQMRERTGHPQQWERRRGRGRATRGDECDTARTPSSKVSIDRQSRIQKGRVAVSVTYGQADATCLCSGRNHELQRMFIHKSKGRRD